MTSSLGYLQFYPVASIDSHVVSAFQEAAVGLWREIA